MANENEFPSLARTRTHAVPRRQTDTHKHSRAQTGTETGRREEKRKYETERAERGKGLHNG